MILTPGTALRPYLIVAHIGDGGMGVVYKAEDTRLRRTVALKVLQDSMIDDPDGRRRIEQEARAASALNHPNIITVHDIDITTEPFYIAMEFVEGKSLRQLITRGPLETGVLFDIATQMATGLAKAHSVGMVHRDLKPENVMLTPDGLVKILDFGLAKRTPEASDRYAETTYRETVPGTMLGTVAYMSPEQAKGQPTGVRSDQFAFGAVVYEMATGQQAFAKGSWAETVSSILRDEPPLLAALDSNRPASVGQIVSRCLAKEPSDRFDSTTDLQRELEHAKEALGSSDSRRLDLELLQSISRVVAQKRNVETVLRSIVTGLHERTACALARIWLIGAGDICSECRMRQECPDQERCLHLAASAGSSRVSPLEDWSRIDGSFQRFPLTVRKIGRVGASGSSVLVDDVNRGEWLARPEWARTEGIQSVAVHPLVFGDDILGVLAVFSRPQIGPEEFGWLRVFADQAAVAIANARAFEELRRLRDEATKLGRSTREPKSHS